MDLSETDIVRPEDERPAKPNGTCFYCSQTIGQPHRSDCVIVSKTVVITATIKLVVSVPRNWNAENIDFKYNESSWCADNLLEALGRWAEARGAEEAYTSTGASCSCGAVDIVCGRDATQEDHDMLPVIIE